MLFPKQKDMWEFIGNKCEFSQEYYRSSEKPESFPSLIAESSYKIVTPVEWKIYSPVYYKEKPRTGWIVGFGWIYNGEITEEYGDQNQLINRTRINYVRIRTSPTGKEIKVPVDNVTVL